MVLLFLLGIAVLLRFVGPVHLSVKGKLIGFSSHTEKCFWSLSKKILNNFCNSNFPSLICPDGSIVCSTDKAKLFGSYFSANSLSNFNAPDPPSLPLTNPILSIIISALKVCRVLRFLKADKALSPDGISPRFLKEFADELALILLLGSMHLFSLFLRRVTTPTPPNYCPIALTSAIAKVFKNFNSHFIKHL